MTTEQFKKLAMAYTATVAYAVGLFHEHLGIQDLLQWRQLGLQRTGYVTADKTISYSFHGIGCCLETPDQSIDWDFGPQGRIDGFDLWRLKTFAEDRPAEFGNLTKEELENAFNEAIQSGLVCKAQDEPVGHLYYFTRPSHTTA